MPVTHKMHLCAACNKHLLLRVTKCSCPVQAVPGGYWSPLFSEGCVCSAVVTLARESHRGQVLSLAAQISYSELVHVAVKLCEYARQTGPLLH